MLTRQHVERYSRQIILPEIGGRGQERLLSAGVAIVGAGSVARLAGLYLTGAGVGRLDYHPGASAAGLDDPALAADVAALNPDVTVSWRPTPYPTDRADLFLVATGDGRDLSHVNAVAVAGRIALVAATAAGASGWVGTFMADDPARSCAACVEPPLASDATASDGIAIAPAVAGGVAAHAALEALALLLRLAQGRAGVVWRHDGRTGETTRVDVPRRADCPVCGNRPGDG